MGLQLNASLSHFSVEVELELERPSVAESAAEWVAVEVLERVAAAARLRLRVERVLAVVVLFPHF